MWLYNILMDIYNNGYQPINNTDNNTDSNIQTYTESDRNSVSVGVQTDFVYYTSFNIQIDDTNDIDYESSFFKHLAFADQTYYDHFCDSIKYSWRSLRASFYFFCHAIWPDIYIKAGSDSVHELSNIIREKYTNRINELTRQRLQRNNLN